MSQNGKGDKTRPRAISYDQFADRWDAAFKKKSKSKKPKSK